MADTAIKSEEEKKEYFDPPEELEAKIEQLAEWVRESTHFISFTGAGISTSAGIPDFRSGQKTVLATGPGSWEKKANSGKSGEKPSSKTKLRVEIAKALPTPTHMAFVTLMKSGLLKFVVSQNVDGLHRRSGVPPEALSEVHGNTNLEQCKKCGKDYMRDFRVRNNHHVHKHGTGRRCDDSQCNGELHDSIINFGENLNERVIESAFAHAERADLCLAMGSSLRVTPAADIPKTTAKRGRLVIVNLQKTPLDHRAALTIHAFCDTVIQMLMAKLGLEIEEFRLVRRLKVCRDMQKPKGGSRTLVECLTFCGVDVDGSPYSLFPKIEVNEGAKVHNLSTKPMKVYGMAPEGHYKTTVHFHGHYSEPPLSLDLQPGQIPMDGSLLFVLTYNPFSKQWDDIHVE